MNGESIAENNNDIAVTFMNIFINIFQSVLGGYTTIQKF